MRIPVVARDAQFNTTSLIFYSFTQEISGMLMNQTYKESFMRDAVDRFHSGQSVALLCAQLGVPCSTISAWIKQFKKLQSSGNTEISCKDYNNLKRHAKKLEGKKETC